MERNELNKISTHILILEGERFPVYHKERRLYSFVDWKDSRDKLIKIMLAKIKVETGENTAFIDFKMANPMRKTRLGNFFIDLIADVKVHGKSLGTLEELGMKNILLDSFETLDVEELEMRLVLEAKYAEEQYTEELNKRITNLSNLLKVGYDELNHLKNQIKNQVAKSMEKEGWSINSDNRFLARRRRLELIQN
jgi:hypothetical protein